MTPKKTTAKATADKVKAKAEEMKEKEIEVKDIKESVASINPANLFQQPQPMTCAAPEPLPTKPVDNKVKIRMNWEEIELDLDKQCPKELLATAKYVAMPYMTIKMIRKIARAKGRRVEIVERKHEVTATGMILAYTVKVILGYVNPMLMWPTTMEDKVFEGSAMDFIAGKAVSKSLDGQNARVKALAIKDALKRKFPFFDINLDEADEAMNTKRDDASFTPVPTTTKTTTVAAATAKAPVSTTAPATAWVNPRLDTMSTFKTMDSLKSYMTSNRDEIMKHPEVNQVLADFNKLTKKLTESTA